MITEYALIIHRIILNMFITKLTKSKLINMWIVCVCEYFHLLWKTPSLTVRLVKCYFNKSNRRRLHKSIGLVDHSCCEC